MRNAQKATNLHTELETAMNSPVTATTAVAEPNTDNSVPFAFTDDDVKQADKHAKKVLTELGKAEKAFTSVACQIKWLYESDRYKALETASTFEQFINNRFGLKKSQGYALIKIVDRFGQVDDKGEYSIKKEYEQFGQSKLMLMCSLTDEQIKENITPIMSVSDLRKKVKELSNADALGIFTEQETTEQAEPTTQTQKNVIDSTVVSETNVQTLISYENGLDFANDIENLLALVNKVYKAKPQAKITVSYEWV